MCIKYINGKNNIEYKLELDECSYTVFIYDSSQKPIGSISFEEVNDDQWDTLQALKIHTLDIDIKHKRQGLGEAAIRLSKEYFDLPIIAEDYSGDKNQGASRLVSDGVGFVIKMREIGLVLPLKEEKNPFEDDYFYEEEDI